jgi:hypothetical protein
VGVDKHESEARVWVGGHATAAAGQGEKRRHDIEGRRRSGVVRGCEVGGCVIAAGKACGERRARREEARGRKSFGVFWGERDDAGVKPRWDAGESLDGPHPAAAGILPPLARDRGEKGDPWGV